MQQGKELLTTCYPAPTRPRKWNKLLGKKRIRKNSRPNRNAPAGGRGTHRTCALPRPAAGSGGAIAGEQLSVGGHGDGHDGISDPHLMVDLLLLLLLWLHRRLAPTVCGGGSGSSGLQDGGTSRWSGGDALDGGVRVDLLRN